MENYTCTECAMDFIRYVEQERCDDCIAKQLPVKNIEDYIESRRREKETIEERKKKLEISQQYKIAEARRAAERKKIRYHGPIELHSLDAHVQEQIREWNVQVSNVTELVREKIYELERGYAGETIYNIRERMSKWERRVYAHNRAKFNELGDEVRRELKNIRFDMEFEIKKIKDLINKQQG